MLNPYGVPSKNLSFHPRVKTRGYQHIAPTEQMNILIIKNFSNKLGFVCLPILLRLRRRVRGGGPYNFVTTSSKFKIALHTTTIAAVSGLLCSSFTPIISQAFSLSELNFSNAFLYKPDNIDKSLLSIV